MTMQLVQRDMPELMTTMLAWGMATGGYFGCLSLPVRLARSRLLTSVQYKCDVANMSAFVHQGVRESSFVIVLGEHHLS